MQSIINIKERFGNQLQEIFREDGKFASLTFEGLDTPIVRRKYMYIEQIETDALLFIGLNPSGGEIAQNDHMYYKLLQTGNSYPRYWKPFEVISAATKPKLIWSHIDLLGVRETKQKLVQSIYRTDLGVDFILEQLKVARQIIEEAKPRIIVVCNTLARYFTGVEISADKLYNIWMGLQFEFDNELGTEKIVSEGSLKGTPVFFTSMLSGQRALDNGSEKRLIWHINRVNQILDYRND
jgi:hypothetical protein